MLPVLTFRTPAEAVALARHGGHRRGLDGQGQPRAVDGAAAAGGRGLGERVGPLRPAVPPARAGRVPEPAEAARVRARTDHATAGGRTARAQRCPVRHGQVQLGHQRRARGRGEHRGVEHAAWPAGTSPACRRRPPRPTTGRGTARPGGRARTAADVRGARVVRHLGDVERPDHAASASAGCTSTTSRPRCTPTATSAVPGARRPGAVPKISMLTSAAPSRAPAVRAAATRSRPRRDARVRSPRARPPDLPDARGGPAAPRRGRAGRPVHDAAGALVGTRRPPRPTTSPTPSPRPAPRSPAGPAPPPTTAGRCSTGSRRCSTSRLDRLGPTAADARAAADRWLWYAGWTDKIAGVLGTVNPVAGPLLSWSAPRADRRGRVLAPQPRRCSGWSTCWPPVLATGAHRRRRRRRRSGRCRRSGSPSCSPPPTLPAGRRTSSPATSPSSPRAGRARRGHGPGPAGAREQAAGSTRGGGTVKRVLPRPAAEPDPPATPASPACGPGPRSRRCGTPSAADGPTRA